MLGLVQSVLSCLWCDHVNEGGEEGAHMLRSGGGRVDLDCTDVSCVTADGKAPHAGSADHDSSSSSTWGGAGSLVPAPGTRSGCLAGPWLVSLCSLWPAVMSVLGGSLPSQHNHCSKSQHNSCPSINSRFLRSFTAWLHRAFSNSGMLSWSTECCSEQRCPADPGLCGSRDSSDPVLGAASVLAVG